MRIFIAGPRAITRLGESVEDRLYGISEKNYTILVGDANGVDKAIQLFFSKLDYDNVKVYASNGKARNNIGNWQVEQINVPSAARGFDFYAAKDKAMTKDADYGFMLWNGKSKGTLNNIINLLKQDKKVLVFFTPQNSYVNIDSFEKLEDLLNYCEDEARELYAKLKAQIVKRESINAHAQLSLI